MPIAVHVESDLSPALDAVIASEICAEDFVPFTRARFEVSYPLML